MSYINKIIQITFEDHGQECLTWEIEKGIIVDCEPPQKFFWNGCKLLKAEVGGLATVERKGVKMEVKHPIASIDEELDEEKTEIRIH